MVSKGRGIRDAGLQMSACHTVRSGAHSVPQSVCALGVCSRFYGVCPVNTEGQAYVLLWQQLVVVRQRPPCLECNIVALAGGQIRRIEEEGEYFISKCFVDTLLTSL